MCTKDEMTGSSSEKGQGFSVFEISNSINLSNVVILVYILVILC